MHFSGQMIAKVLLACGLLASCALGQGQMDSQGNMGAQTESAGDISQSLVNAGICTYPDPVDQNDHNKAL